MEKSLALLRLKLNLFNRCMSSVIFAFKILMLNLCILGFAAALKLFSSNHPVFALFYFILGANALIAYPGVFNDAFRISSYLDVLETRLYAKGSKCGRRMWMNRNGRNSMKQGMKTGNFQILERESTLIFVYFVSTAIANLLLAT